MKAIEYRAIPTLQEYVLVAQSRLHVEHWQRHGAEEWLLRDLRDREQTLELPSIGCRLLVADIYERVFE
jgi:Uma2 family endonuclease